MISTASAHSRGQKFYNFLVTTSPQETVDRYNSWLHKQTRDMQAASRTYLNKFYDFLVAHNCDCADDERIQRFEECRFDTPALDAMAHFWKQQGVSDKFIEIYQRRIVQCHGFIVGETAPSVVRNPFADIILQRSALEQIGAYHAWFDQLTLPMQKAYTISLNKFYYYLEEHNAQNPDRPILRVEDMKTRSLGFLDGLPAFFEKQTIDEEIKIMHQRRILSFLRQVGELPVTAHLQTLSYKRPQPDKRMREPEQGATAPKKLLTAEQRHWQRVFEDANRKSALNHNLRENLPGPVRLIPPSGLNNGKRLTRS